MVAAVANDPLVVAVLGAFETLQDVDLVAVVVETDCKLLAFVNP